jgi:hypothetical protein
MKNGLKLLLFPKVLKITLIPARQLRFRIKILSLPRFRILKAFLFWMIARKMNYKIHGKSYVILDQLLVCLNRSELKRLSIIIQALSLLLLVRRQLSILCFNNL